MQTFLPYSSFEDSAKVLDYKRLGKQRVETKQIIETLRGRNKGWANHPAVKMWRGCEHALALYGIEICKEWILRGYQDTLLKYFQEEAYGPLKFPLWLGLPEFHSSHRSNLLRKDYEHYSQFGWEESPDQEYVWPTKLVEYKDSDGK